MESGQLHSFDGTRLAYHVAGSGNEWLVIANAPGMSQEFWVPLLRELPERFRFLLWDYRGISPSGLPSVAERLTVADHARDLGVLLDHLGIERAHFLGWCIGPRVLLAHYLEEPERFRSLATLAFSYNVPSDWAEASRFDELMLTLAERIKVNPRGARIAAQVLKLYREDDYQQLIETIEGEHEMQDLTDLVGVLGGQSAVADLSLGMLKNEEDFRSYFHIYADMLNYGVREILTHVQVPFLAVAGAADSWTPPSPIRALCEIVPNGSYAEIPDATHYLLLERPTAVLQALVEFWGSLERRVGRGWMLV